MIQHDSRSKALFGGLARLAFSVLFQGVAASIAMLGSANAGLGATG